MMGYARDSVGFDRDTLGKVITAYRDIVDSLDERVGTDAIIIDFCK